jgi:hypothetical protein
MHLTASTAIGEIGGAFLPRRAFAAMSANSKNFRRAWLPAQRLDNWARLAVGKMRRL